MAPRQGEYLAIEGPPAPYTDSTNARAHATGPVLPTEATVNTLWVQKYGGGGWHALRATGATATPVVLANRLAEAQTTQVMADISMPKYSGNPEHLDEFERTWNKYVNEMGCNEAQRQRFYLSMLTHCVPANVKKSLDDWGGGR